MPSFAGYGEVRAKSPRFGNRQQHRLYLKKFQAHGCEVLGVEPARNIAELAEQAGVRTWIDFFNSPNAAHIRNEWANRTSCWAGTCWRTLTIGSTVAGLEEITHAQSLIAFEVPYLRISSSEQNLTRSTTSICPTLASVRSRRCCREHRSICSAWIIIRFMAGPCWCKSGLARTASQCIDSVAAHVQRERDLKLLNRRVGKIRAAGAAYSGAAAGVIHDLRPATVRLRSVRQRQHTAQHLRGLPQGLDYVIDNTPFKTDKVTPGSWIPIARRKRCYRTSPTNALLLAWNFAAEIVDVKQNYQRRGGRFIVPIPDPKIVEFSGN